MPNRQQIASCVAVVLIPSLLLAGDFPDFTHKTIDPDVGKVCYAVTLADVNNDDRDDIVAVTENRVLWYENPSWKQWTIIENQTERDNVCIAPADIDGDGQVDFALGAGWTEIGTLQWLSRGETLKKKWTVHRIAKEKWLHRMRFGDVIPGGKPELVISPIYKHVGEGVRLTALQIPENPRQESWPRHVMDHSLNRLHNHWHVDLDGDGTVDTLTASQEGINLIRRTKSGWNRTPLARGMAGDKPENSGAGEVDFGRLENGEAFIATIEPMHGTHVVVYTEPQKGAQQWTRHVLYEDLQAGHAVWTADFDGDEADEIVIGYRKGDFGLFIFDAANKAGTNWARHVIDADGIAVEDAIAGDLTGDGRVDLVAGGRATHNVKLYVNQGAK